MAHLCLICDHEVDPCCEYWMDATFVLDGERKAYVIDGTPRDMMHRDCHTRQEQELQESYARAMAEDLSYTLSGQDSERRYVLMQGGVGIMSGSLVEIRDFLERVASCRS